MPRKNIFASKKLTLDYNGNRFALLRNDNKFGRYYNLRRASNLAVTILREKQKSSHKMEYNLEQFKITSPAIGAIRKYNIERKVNK